MQSPNELEARFRKFCGVVGAEAANPTLDNAKFVKLCRESGWVDAMKFPKPSVDLVWAKVMRKDRKMTLEKFREAVQEIATRSGNSIEALTRSIPDAPVGNQTTQFADDDWVKKQTDHTKYTGAHKLKFDAESGKGLGLAGRVDTNVRDLSDVLNRGAYDIRGRNVEILEKQNQEKATR